MTALEAYEYEVLPVDSNNGFARGSRNSVSSSFMRRRRCPEEVPHNRTKEPLEKFSMAMSTWCETSGLSR